MIRTPTETDITTILYIRHGEVEGNNPASPDYSYTGCKGDPHLTEKGVSQAKAVAERLLQLQEEGKIGKIAAVYSSTLSRARNTAKESADRLGLEVQERHDLREIDWGFANSKRVQEMTEQFGELEKQIKEQYPNRKERWNHVPVFPGAETLNQLLERSTEELQKIGASHLGATVVVFGHGRVLKTLIRASDLEGKGKLPYPSNGSITEFKCSPENGVQFVRMFSA
jgi:broad specificity phosphatase PhoE